MATKKEIDRNKKADLNEISVEELKIEILDYAETNLDSRINELVKKADKKLIRQKNITIFIKNIFILILIAIIVFLTYLLYNEGYFDKYLNINRDNNVVEKVNPVNKEDNTSKEKEDKLETLKTKYSYLLDNIKIDTNSKYLNEFYSGKLTNKLKLYMTFLNINDNNYVKDEDLYTINSKDVLTKYSELFNTDNYKDTSFDLNNVNIKYLNAGKVYMFDNMFNYNKEIEREIIGIIEKDKTIKITCVEGLVKDNKTYNILTKEEINNDKSLKDSVKKLNKITYVFTKNNDGYILEGLEN